MSTSYRIYASPQRSPETVDTPLVLLRVWSVTRDEAGAGHRTTSFVAGGLTYAEAQATCRALEIA